MLRVNDRHISRPLTCQEAAGSMKRRNKSIIGGNVPVSLLYTGTVRQVKDYVRERIDVVGEGGGLIVGCGIWFDDAKHENVKAVVDFTKEYGVYFDNS